MNGEIHLGYRYTPPPLDYDFNFMILGNWPFFVFDIGSASYLSL